MNARTVMEFRRNVRKPVVFDEVGYEGDVGAVWGDLPGQTLVQHFWEGAILGGYVGHSEAFLDPENKIWWTTGGVLRGESPPRIAFLLKILEEGPPEGLDPIDVEMFPWFRGGTVTLGAKEGEYYLYYLGDHQPGELVMALPAGGPYAIDIIDTWEMRMSPVPGKFMGVPAVKRLDKPWRWDGMVTIKMPRKPYQALRIRKSP